MPLLLAAQSSSVSRSCHSPVYYCSHGLVIFGEIVPQSLCVRFGLPIGAVMSPFVLVLMWIFAPITWPIAKLLDWLLGEDHGTTYKKAGLKTLVDLHKTIGTTPGDRLNEDEVAIISGVLDLKAKAVGSIMTPMGDVFTLSAEAVLDEDMIEDIMREGYSRIPIHDPNNKGDFVGMLLVKMLITYDPEDARRVNEFALATLPETRPDTSCLDIINFFQEGKSHMVLVSDFPGQSYGALGVVTLEDVIEELIGEEIIDESDVFIDIHKALRRAAPAPTHRHARASKGQIVPDNNSQAVGDERQLFQHHNGENGETERKAITCKRGSTASIDRKTTFLMRRPSNQSVDGNGEVRQVQLNTKDAELRQSLRSLGPSNVASRPRQTRINTIISKPGVGTIPENKDAAKQLQMSTSPSQATNTERPITTPDPTAAQEGIGEDELIAPGTDASDGIQALHTEYGTLDRDVPSNGDGQSRSESRGAQISSHGGLKQYSSEARPNKMVLQESGSHSTIGSLHSQSSGELPRKRRHTARSGSITENIIESGGRQKMVLEPSSSSDDENGASLQPQSSKNRSRGPSHQGRSKDHAHANGRLQESERGQDGSKDDANGKAKAKKRRPHRHRKKKDGSKGDENTPLLSRD